ncbi:MAG TPA: monovalent cation/H+ antiporter subunit D family protein [Clostridiales bacterium UBA8153]|nr:monovalent cation/H+ antiporter subunit D family protein [Clostridiales bacterium UBA8153]
MTSSAWTVLPVGVLLGSGYAIPLVYRRYPHWLGTMVLGAGSAALGMAGYLAYLVATAGPVQYFLGGWGPPWGIEVLVDRWSALGLLTVTGVGLPVLLYALYSARDELETPLVGKYFGLVLILMAAMMGTVMAADVFNLFVFVEVLSLAACAIVAIKGDRIATEASLRYLILGSIGSGTILLGIALLYMVTGHLNMAFAGTQMAAALLEHPQVVYAGLGFLVLGLSIKAALFPLHVWLPDAHASAPTASSALLSGLVVKAYIFGLWRIFAIMFGEGLLEAVPIRALLLAMATLGILAGSILAIGQTDLKLMLAYSTVANVGYVFLGLGLGSERAMLGAALHILNHGLMKASLFLAAGNLLHATETRHVRRLGGVGARMPWTMGAFTVAAMSMVGIPPLNGFVSKLYLALGALDAGSPFYVMVILVASLLTGLYYAPIIIAAYFEPEGPHRRAHEPVWACTLPPVLLALGCVLLGLYPAALMAILGG